MIGDLGGNLSQCGNNNIAPIAILSVLWSSVHVTHPKEIEADKELQGYSFGIPASSLDTYNHRRSDYVEGHRSPFRNEVAQSARSGSGHLFLDVRPHLHTSIADIY